MIGTIFTQFIMICMILQCLWHIFRTKSVLKKISVNKDANISKQSKIKLFIIIPCLEEQKVIRDTIEYFSNLINQKEGIDSEVFIVTTNKEQKRKNTFTTYEIVNEYISDSTKYSNIKLINYPFDNGMMADQLNYAQRMISQNVNFEKNKAYFCVYNADSRPGKNMFEEVKEAVLNNNYPLIMQEYSAFFSNIKNLSPLMKGFATYQTNFEITNGLTNAALPSKFLRNHVVGHGLFIRFDYLEKIGGFTTDYWCEDIYLSFHLRSNNVPIIPLYSVELGEAPKNLKILMKQNGNWFKTLSETAKIYKSFSKSTKNFNGTALLYYLNQIRGAIAWLLLPTLYIIIFFVLLFTAKWLLLCIFTSVYFSTTFIRYLLSTYIVKGIVGYIPYDEKILAAESVLAYLISNIGPWYAVFNRKASKYKTER